jgi:hypothetical protein
MKKTVFISILSVITLIGCGGGGNEDTQESTAIPIYNQAYQENFEADTIEEILTSATDAYVLIDPFEAGVVEHIATIKEQNNQIGGYISAGTGEDWRDDFSELEPYLSSVVWDEWEGEYYVSQTTTGIVEVMKKRIDKMAEWGIDWVEFDNMDWFDEETKEAYRLELSEEEAIQYINTLCDYTHQKGMKCMAKNSVEGFEDFDGVLYESYSGNKNWWDEEGTELFLDQKKLVIINHYDEDDCDGAYEQFNTHYDTQNISFICEDRTLEKYRHYHQ